MAGFERTGCTLEAGACSVDATGLVAAGAVTAGLFIEDGPGPVEAGPAPIAFFSAALIISSLMAIYEFMSIYCVTPEDLLEQIQTGTSDNPFHAIFVAFAKRLPHLLFLFGLSCYGNSRSSTLFWSVLGNFTKLSLARKCGRSAVLFGILRFSVVLTSTRLGGI
jgi:hypothetical protein